MKPELHITTKPAAANISTTPDFDAIRCNIAELLNSYSTNRCVSLHDHTGWCSLSRMSNAFDIPGLDLAEDHALTPAGERILEVASRLFYWYGIHAVGVARIANEAQVIKKTIFDRFGSKDVLIVAYLKRRNVRWRQRIRAALSEIEVDSPEAQILAAFDALQDWVADENPRGCAFVNAYAEITDPQHPGYRIIVQQKQWLQGFFTEIAKRAGCSQPQALSEKLMILYEGATVINSMRLVDAPVTTARAGRGAD